MKIQQFTAVGLFLVALHLKFSRLGIGPTITWFEVWLPLLLLWTWGALAFVLDTLKITQKIDLMFARKILAFYVWRKRREAEAVQRNILKKASK